MNALQQREADLKALADLNTRMYVAVWVNHAALNIAPKYLPVDEFSSDTSRGFSIVPRVDVPRETTPALPVGRQFIPDVN